MRITVLCADVSQNGLARALLLADMLRGDFDVDVVGTRFGPAVWGPESGRALHRVVAGTRLPLYAWHAAQLLGSIRGDVVYAVKPLPTSYGLALRHRARTGTPVVLDIDDDELAFRPAVSPMHPLRLASSLTTPNGRPWTRRMMSRIAAADAITVASTALQARFGGTLVPHAKDMAALRPDQRGRGEVRREAALDNEQVVMFVGTPRPFKGLEIAAEAVRLMRSPARFVVAGADPDDPYVAQLRRDHPDVVVLPPFEASRLSAVLSAADVVVVPQRADPRTAFQLPSKLLDAMAMAKPVVATAVADIPAILADGRGLVVPPDDARAMASALDSVLADPAAAAAMGARARDWCLAHASFASVRQSLVRVFTGLARPS